MSRLCRLLSGKKACKEDDILDVPAGFDVTKSTEDNYRVAHFTGVHADIRPLLDYTYHAKYTEARVELQDKLIQRHLVKNSQPLGDEMLPWVVFTAGAMGAGKGYVTGWMQKNGYFPLERFIIVDPDAIRKELPEWKAYVNHDPETAGDLTQKEAGCIAEILGYKALRERHNVVFDGSLRDSEWYMTYFEKLRKEHPGVRIMILHVVADRAEILTNVTLRSQKSSRRSVPEDLMVRCMEAVPESVTALAPHADFVVRVLNSRGQDPQIVREEGAPYPHPDVELSWNFFKRLWDSVDLDGDGELSPSEIQVALAQGLLSQRVVETIDKDCDGNISKHEIAKAKMQSYESGVKRYR